MSVCVAFASLIVLARPTLGQPIIGPPNAGQPAPTTAESSEDVPIPGTGDDPIRELALDPGVVDTPQGLSIRGGAPADTLLLLDGFRIPWIDHIGGARSIVTRFGYQPVVLLARGFDTDFGSGSSLVGLSLRRTRVTRGGDVALVTSGYASEVTGAVGGRLRATGPQGLIVARSSSPEASLPSIAATDPTRPAYLDVQLATENSLDSKLTYYGEAIGAFELHRRWFVRPIVAVAFVNNELSVTFRTSGLFSRTRLELGPEQHLSADELDNQTRVQIARAVPHLAGLTSVVLQIGAQAGLIHHDIDIAWPFLPRDGLPQAASPNPGDTSLRATRGFFQRELGLWTAIAGNLSPDIRAQIGVRVDAFDTDYASDIDDVATQPRGTLDWRLRHDTMLRLAAGSYRRPPNQLDELLVEDLVPERTAQIDLSVAHNIATGIDVLASTYYIDRSRLITRERDGILRNSGLGTSYGIEGTIVAHRDPWYARLATSVSRSVRRDNPQALERPSQYDQPFRLDALVSWHLGNWQLGARLRLASGLPYTPVVGTIYDSDHDYYEPLFSDQIYSARSPLQHRIDLRVDRTFELGKGPTLAAFLDLHNAYASRSPIGYDYSFDYREQQPIYALPIFPFIGLRGSL